MGAFWSVPKRDVMLCCAELCCAKVNGTCDLPVLPHGSSGHCAPNKTGEPQVELLDVERLDEEEEGFPPGGDSLERCNSLCAPLGYPFFGSQAGHACFCGAHYGTMGAAPEGACSSPCQANASEYCGGPDANSVWKTVAVGV